MTNDREMKRLMSRLVLGYPIEFEDSDVRLEPDNKKRLYSIHLVNDDGMFRIEFDDVVIPDANHNDRLFDLMKSGERTGMITLQGESRLADILRELHYTQR